LRLCYLKRHQNNSLDSYYIRNSMTKSKAIRRKIRYSSLYRFIQFLIFLSNILPRVAWLNFCGFLGRIAYTLTTKNRELALQHLKLAFGSEKSDAEINILAKNVFRYLGKNAGDIIRSTRVKNLRELEEFLVTEGLENYETAHAKKKGVIFLTCHLGAFDLQITNMAMRGLDPNIIGTPLKDKNLNNLLWNYRNLHGAIAIERGKETFRLIKVLKSGGSVALLIDQDTKVKSEFVNFFGLPASTPVGATVLALKTGAAVIPTYIYLGEDNLQHMHILPEVEMRITGDEQDDIVYNTQILTNFIEEKIRQHPEQWVWMHERWKTQKGVEA
jgi:Kdo2-lipid IVA lauroyltransferase/acyltransferase